MKRITGHTSGNFEKGHEPWNKGKSGIYSKETLEKHVEEHILAHKEHHAEDHYIDDLLEAAAKEAAVSPATSVPGWSLSTLYAGYLYVIYSGGHQYE